MIFVDGVERVRSLRGIFAVYLIQVVIFLLERLKICTESSFGGTYCVLPRHGPITQNADNDQVYTGSVLCSDSLCHWYNALRKVLFLASLVAQRSNEYVDNWSQRKYVCHCVLCGLTYRVSRERAVYRDFSASSEHSLTLFRLSARQLCVRIYP